MSSTKDVTITPFILSLNGSACAKRETFLQSNSIFTTCSFQPCPLRHGHSVHVLTDIVSHAEPSPNRKLMGIFDKVQDASNVPTKITDKSNIADKAEITAIREDLVLQTNEIKTIKHPAASYRVLYLTLAIITTYNENYSHHQIMKD